MTDLLKYSILVLSIMILIQGFISCNEEVCPLPDRNTTSDLLARVARENNYDYCDILASAIKGNKHSIQKLALLRFSDAAGYDHGAVLIEVVLQVGQQRFIDAVRYVNENERNAIESYLKVGLEYGYRKEYEKKRLRDVFPALHSFLNGNEATGSIIHLDSCRLLCFK